MLRPILYGDYDGAVKTLNKIIDIDPHNSEALIEITRNYILEKKFDQAKETIEKVLSKDPNNTDAMVMEGEILLTLGAYRDAIASYNRALKVDPQKLEAFSGRARAALLQGRFNAALIDGRQVIRHDRLNPMDDISLLLHSSRQGVLIKLRMPIKPYPQEVKLQTSHRHCYCKPISTIIKKTL